MQKSNLATWESTNECVFIEYRGDEFRPQFKLALKLYLIVENKCARCVLPDYNLSIAIPKQAQLLLVRLSNGLNWLFSRERNWWAATLRRKRLDWRRMVCWRIHFSWIGTWRSFSFLWGLAQPIKISRIRRILTRLLLTSWFSLLIINHILVILTFWLLSIWLPINCCLLVILCIFSLRFLLLVYCIELCP